MASSTESLSDQDFYKLHDALSNSEAKMVTLGALALHPDTKFSITTLNHEIESLQGEIAGWKPAYQVSGQYCDFTFEPIGAVVKGEMAGMRSKPVASYEVSEFGVVWGLAYIGAAAPWSLENPSISVHRLFGNTASSGKIRGTEVRHRVLMELATAAGPLSYTQAVGGLQSETLGSLVADEAIRDLARSGIVEAISVFDDDFDPVFEIVAPEYNHHVKKFDELLPSTQAHYIAIQKLHREGKRQLPVSELIRETFDIDDTLNPISQRRRLINNLVDEDRPVRMGIRLVDRKGLELARRTNVKINDELAAPINNLLDRTESMRSASGREIFAKEARNLLRDPAKVRRLMSKAKADSPNYRGRKEGTEALTDRIYGIIDVNGGQASTNQIYAALKEAGTHYSLESIRKRLVDLTKSGKMAVEEKNQSEMRGRKTKFYSPKID